MLSPKGEHTMLRFIKQEKVPIGGFTFTDPDTFRVFHANNYNTFEELEDHVQTYRAQNGLPPITQFREVWEHYVCSNNPAMQRECCPVDAEIARTFRQYVSGAKVFVKSLLQKEEDKFVDKKEAERRAEICMNCPFNRKNTGHSLAQFYTDKFMAMSVGKRRVKQWQHLYTCMGCSCILATKVWFSAKIVGQSMTREDITKMRAMNPRCWQLEARENLNGKDNKSA